MQSLSDTGWFVESCDAITFVMAFSSTLAHTWVATGLGPQGF